jgi:hypothetical protein
VKRIHCHDERVYRSSYANRLVYSIIASHVISSLVAFRSVLVSLSPSLTKFSIERLNSTRLRYSSAPFSLYQRERFLRVRSFAARYRDMSLDDINKEHTLSQ